MISFCTWIKNRFHQFDQCWEINLERMDEDSEWIIIDAGSSDGMESWVSKDSRVKVIKHPVEHLHFAKMYNLSHSYATKPILVNLDADNFIGPRFCEWAKQIIKDRKVGHPWSNDWDDGTYGRLVYSRSMFNEVGGYDENLGPLGYQDTDIMQRMSAAGYHIHTTDDQGVYGGSIPNTREDSAKYVDSDKGYSLLNSENHYQSLQNLKHKKIKANQ